MVLTSENLLATLNRLLRHVSTNRKYQLALVLGLMLSGGFAEIITLGTLLPFLALLANPQAVVSYPMFHAIFAGFGWTKSNQILVSITLLFVAVVLTTGVIRLLLTWALQNFVYRFGHDLSVEVYRRTLYQPYPYHVAKNTSELIAAVTKVDAVVNGTLLHLMQLITAGTISVFIVAALVVINPMVAVSAAVGFAAIYVGVTYVTRGRLRKNSITWALAQNERVKALQEGLGGIRNVLIDQTQASSLAKYSAIDQKLRIAQAMNAFIATAPRYIIEACGTVFIAVMALLLSQAKGGLVSTLPVLGTLALGAQRLLPLLQTIYHAWTDIAYRWQSLQDVLTILDLPIESVDLLKSRSIDFKGEIVLHKVGFSYACNMPLVLHEVNLTIRKGGRIGLIGKTGSGKSTVADLIMGLLEPTAGKITIDGITLAKENVRDWQAQIAHVPQSIFLADKSIAENIAFGLPKETIDSRRLHTAARHSGLASFIERLPEGYDTIVGERGVRLSGGQRQYIGIARALYKGASVLVLDEATSALDNETETAVISSIESLSRDLTLIIIAHRLSTVRICDQIFCLENGCLVRSVELPHGRDRELASLEAEKS
jgi:ABC-type bacteriocin/lantibiotic exporter with double-glycine peptidase domain